MSFLIIYFLVQLWYFGTVLGHFTAFSSSLANHGGQHFYLAPHHKKASYSPVSKMSLSPTSNSSECLEKQPTWLILLKR